MAVELSAGNENEQRYFLSLIDTVRARGMHPAEVWADRGYASRAHEQALTERGIESRISQPRKRGQPIPPGSPTRVVWRGKQKRIKTPDPDARHRWPIERTIGWLKGFRRIATRRDRKAATYLGFLQLGIILILLRAF